MSGIRRHNLDSWSHGYAVAGQERIRLPNDNVQAIAAEQVIPAIGANVQLLAPLIPIPSCSFAISVGEFGTPSNDLSLTLRIHGWNFKGEEQQELITITTTVASPVVVQTRNAWRAIDQIEVADRLNVGVADVLAVGFLVDDDPAIYTGAGMAIITTAPTFVLPRIGVPGHVQDLTSKAQVFGLVRENGNTLIPIAGLDEQLQTCTADITGTPTDRELYWSLNPTYIYI